MSFLDQLQQSTGLLTEQVKNTQPFGSYTPTASDYVMGIPQNRFVGNQFQMPTLGLQPGQGIPVFGGTYTPSPFGSAYGMSPYQEIPAVGVMPTPRPGGRGPAEGEGPALGTGVDILDRLSYQDPRLRGILGGEYEGRNIGDTFSFSRDLPFGQAYDQYGRRRNIGATIPGAVQGLANFVTGGGIIGKTLKGLFGSDEDEVTPETLEAFRQLEQRGLDASRQGFRGDVAAPGADASTIGGTGGRRGGAGTAAGTGGTGAGPTGTGGKTPGPRGQRGGTPAGRSFGRGTGKGQSNTGSRGPGGPGGRGGRRGGGGGGGSSPGGGPAGCFVEGTAIQMADGSTKEITSIQIGEETKGGTVQAKMEFMPQNIYNYKDVLVSGSHWVIEDNQFIAVEDSKHGVLTDRIEPVYTFKTSDNRIWINDIEFGDFETGTDEDWEPHFEMVRQKLNKELNDKY